MSDEFEDLFAVESFEPVPVRRKRAPFPWYLLTGLILGIIVGLFVTRVINPIRYTDTAPSALRSEYQADYRRLIADAYAANGDTGRAVQRLALLEDDDPIAVLRGLAERQQETEPEQDGEHLLLLADALEALLPTPEASVTPAPVTATPSPETTATASVTAASTATASPPPTNTPAPTDTATPQPSLSPSATRPPTRTPSPTLPASYRMISQQEVCDPNLPPGLLQVEVTDRSGQPLSGAPVTVRWEDQQETFVTGLYPEISLGYADFEMQPDVEYSLTAGQGGETVSGIIAPQCGSATSGYLGGWRILFAQP